MRKQGEILLIAVGTALLLAALSLLFSARCADTRAGEEAEELLSAVQAVQEGREPPEISKNGTDGVEFLAPELPEAVLEGYACVGTVRIPALELELPVLADWDYERLKLAPCRQFGSSRTEDLVIAAHNYQTHFGRLGELSAGDTVFFTDMDGIVNSYTVAEVRTVLPEDVEAVQNSGYPLVLYTCTLSGRERTAVFCLRSGETERGPGREEY